MPGKAAKVVVTEKQQAILNEFASSRSVSVSLSQRSRIILLAFEGLNNEQIQLRVELGHDQVGRWRRRWRDNWDRLIGIECSEERVELKNAIKELLADNHRTGRPPRIRSEQQAELIAKACEDPQDSGRPIANWTSDELAHQMTTSGVIAQISGRWVRHLLSRAKSDPIESSTGCFPKTTKKIRDLMNVLSHCATLTEMPSRCTNKKVFTRSVWMR